MDVMKTREFVCLHQRYQCSNFLYWFYRKKVTHMDKDTYGVIKKEMERMIVEFQNIKGLPAQVTTKFALHL